MRAKRNLVNLGSHLPEGRIVGILLPVNPNIAPLPVVMAIIPALLLHSWQSVSDYWGLTSESSAAWQKTLVDLYQTADRHYHTLGHVQDLLCHRQMLVERKIPIMTELMDTVIWFHDAIYNPTSQSNETESAALFGRFLEDCSLRDKNKEDYVMLLIIHTQHHINELPSFILDSPTFEQDAQLFLDLDLSILGAEPMKYEVYAKNIRKEYSHVADDLYRRGRSGVLRTFLHSPALYRTAVGLKLWQKQAEHNIAKELQMLDDDVSQ